MKLKIRSPEEVILSNKIVPDVSVDKIRATIPVKHNRVVTGRFNHTPGNGPLFRSLTYRWLHQFPGKIGVKSRNLHGLFIEVNPSTLEHGNNLFKHSDPLALTLLDTEKRIAAQIASITPDRRELLMVRAGRSDLSVLHLRADWQFPSRRDLENCFQHLRRNWTWRFNQKRDISYKTSLYLNHTRWDLVAYIKDDEIAANHKDWDESVKSICRNRMRLEVRLRREELRRLGPKLMAYFPGITSSNLSIAGDWDAWLYKLAFDFYIGRLNRTKNVSRATFGAAALYAHVSTHGGNAV